MRNARRRRHKWEWTIDFGLQRPEERKVYLWEVTTKQGERCRVWSETDAGAGDFARAGGGFRGLLAVCPVYGDGSIGRSRSDTRR